MGVTAEGWGTNLSEQERTKKLATMYFMASLCLFPLPCCTMAAMVAKEGGGSLICPTSWQDNSALDDGHDTGGRGEGWANKDTEKGYDVFCGLSHEGNFMTSTSYKDDDGRKWRGGHFWGNHHCNKTTVHSMMGDLSKGAAYWDGAEQTKQSFPSSRRKNTLRLDCGTC
jgi:hypothetical protein